MEKSKKIALLPLDCGWNDLGSWQAIYDVSKKDKNGNYITGNVIDVDSKDSMIYSTSKLVTTIGLENTVVIETEDALLVCNKDRTQDVKKIYNTLKDIIMRDNIWHSIKIMEILFYVVYFLLVLIVASILVSRLISFDSEPNTSVSTFNSFPQSHKHFHTILPPSRLSVFSKTKSLPNF